MMPLLTGRDWALERRKAHSSWDNMFSKFKHYCIADEPFLCGLPQLGVMVFETKRFVGIAPQGPEVTTDVSFGWSSGIRVPSWEKRALHAEKSDATT